MLSILSLPLFACFVSQGDCPGWSDAFGSAGVGGSVQALATFDDGSGPALYAAGYLTSAGAHPVGCIARWDGVVWSGLPVDFESGNVRALTVFDDGTGAALYAGGTFDHVGNATQGIVPAAQIARWNGTSWSALAAGLDGEVRALCVHDDGTGKALYAGGSFTTSGATGLAHVARWDGSAWHALGAGTDAAVYALHSFDDGSGAKLYAGGAFTQADGAPANFVASWDGSQWSALGAGVQANVLALTSFTLPGHAQPTLIAGGPPLVGTTHVAEWDGNAWSAIGSGPSGPTGQVNTFALYDDGAGTQLYAGAEATNLRGVYRWDGNAWSSLSGSPQSVKVLHVHDEGLGAGAALFIGGGFSSYANVQASGIVRYDAGFSALATTAGLCCSDAALGSFDDGSGRKLYVTGSLALTLPSGTGQGERWNGVSWEFAPGLPYLSAFHVVEVANWFGAGPRLVFCGSFTVGASTYGLALYDGATTSYLAQGAGVLDLHERVENGNQVVYAVGGFTSIDGVPANRIARYDGSSWTALGSGLTGSLTGIVCSDATDFDDGTGLALYAGGRFQFAGGTSTPTGVARWNGTSWSAVGTGSSALTSVRLSVFDDGSGPHLFVGGGFWILDGQSILRIARWNGANFEPVGGGLGNDTVEDLAVFDDGSGGGARLVAAMSGTNGGLLAWDGAAWAPFAGGFGLGDGHQMHVADLDGDRVPELWVTGSIDAVGGLTSLNLARYEACGPVSSFCAGDGVDAHVTTACPCGNVGGPGRGCAWHAGPTGALLAASGTTNPDALVLTASGMPASAPSTIFLKGDVLVPGGVVFGDGVRCIGGNLIRLGTKTNVGGAAQYPEAGNVAISVRGQTPVGSGAIGYYQTYYRNAAVFCTSSTFNVTNAVRVVW